VSAGAPSVAASFMDPSVVVASLPASVDGELSSPHALVPTERSPASSNRAPLFNDVVVWSRW